MAESSTDPTTPLMTGWRRLRSIQGAAVAGIVAAVGWVVALGALLDVPGPTSTDAEITAYYAAHAGSARPLVFLQILVIATIGFLWFIGVIRHRLGAAEPKLFGTVFLGGGILLAGLMFVGVAAAATPAILVGETDRLVDPDAVVTMRVFARIILAVVAPRIASLFVFSMSTLALRTGAMSRWMVGVSYLTGTAMFLNVTIAEPNVFIFPVWMAAVSVYLLFLAEEVKESTHGLGGSEA